MPSSCSDSALPHLFPSFVLHFDLAMTTDPLSIAIIGSSGGGAATLGHTDPQTLLKTIDQEICKIEGKRKCHGIACALFVSLDGGQGFDHANETRDNASLYYIPATDTRACDPFNSVCRIVQAGSLKAVNAQAKRLNKDLATAITKGEIHALICISMIVDIFSETLQSAAATGIPVTGTGGTSLSAAAAEYQIRLVGNAGGSVANTSLTRAVSYAHALALALDLDYCPWSKSKQSASDGPRFRSVLNACLPVFWGVCLSRRTLDAMSITPQIMSPSDEHCLHQTLSLLSYMLQHHAIPTACAAIAATSMSTMTTEKDISSLIMASVLASTVCWDSVACGLIAGYLVSICQEKILYFCIVQHIPATMTNLVATGGTGASIAMALSLVAPYCRSWTAFIRNVILQSVTTSFFPSGCVAFAWGCFRCY